METEIKKDVNSKSFFYELADDIVSIVNGIDVIAVVGIGKDGRTYLSVSTTNREKHEVMAKEMLKASVAIMEDLATDCDCHECTIGNKVH